ncbi:UNVERIFIED_CONTAM: hypothetical protein NCL1_26605 [Trichonephila clavipes]
MFGTSLYRYHTATYPHASDSANRQTNDTIFVASMRAVASLCELRYFCETALSDGLFASMFDGLVAFAVDRWRHDCAQRGCGSFARSGSPMKEGRFDLSTFHSVRNYFIDHAKTIVFARCLVLVCVDITLSSSFLWVSEFNK